MKRKENSFSLQGEEERLSLRISIHKILIERPHFLGNMWNSDED